MLRLQMNRLRFMEKNVLIQNVNILIEHISNRTVVLNGMEMVKEVIYAVIVDIEENIEKKIP